MATLKRELLLLLHGAHIFLDVGGLNWSSDPERSRISASPAAYVAPPPPQMT